MARKDTERSLFSGPETGFIQNGTRANIGGKTVYYRDGKWIPENPIAQPAMQHRVDAPNMTPVSPLPIEGASDTTIIRQGEARLEMLKQARLGAVNAQMHIDDGIARLDREEQEARRLVDDARARSESRGSALAFAQFMNPEVLPLFTPAATPAVVRDTPGYEAPASAMIPAAPVETVTRRRISKKAVAIVLASAAVLGSGGTVAAMTVGIPGIAKAPEAQAGSDANVAVSAELPLDKTASALIDTFAGCFDANAQGASILDAKVTSATPVAWQFTDTAKTAMVLVARNGLSDNVKPVNKQIDAAAGFSACVAPADRGQVLTIDDATHSIKVNLDKISPQDRVQMTSGSKLLRGFVTDDTATQAIDTKGVVDALANAKVIDTAEATRLKTAYADQANMTSETIQASNHTAEALANKDDIYAQQAKAALGAKILNLINTKLDQLRAQRAIANTPVNVELNGTMSHDIAPVGAKPAAANGFSESDPSSIINFQFATGNKS